MHRGDRNRRSAAGPRVDLDACDKPKHVHLLAKAMEFFRTGVSPVNLAETVEAIRFLEAADESRVTGKKVSLK